MRTWSEEYCAGIHVQRERETEASRILYLLLHRLSSSSFRRAVHQTLGGELGPASEDYFEGFQEGVCSSTPGARAVLLTILREVSSCVICLPR